jgi:hypothetical protein
MHDCGATGLCNTLVGARAHADSGYNETKGIMRFAPRLRPEELQCTTEVQFPRAALFSVHQAHADL